MQTFGLPETQGTNVSGAVSDHRHIVRDSQNIAGFHGNNDSLILTADGPWIAVTRPVIRHLDLTSAFKLLFKKTVAETEAVTCQGNIAGDRAIEKTGGKTAKTAVSEGIILNIFKSSKIDTLFRKQFSGFIKYTHAVQIIVYQTTNKKFHGKISRFPVRKTYVFLFFPQRRYRIHCRTGNGIMQFHRGCVFPFFVCFSHQTKFSIFDQCFRVHRIFYLLFVSVFSRLYFMDKSRVRLPDFIRHSQFPPIVPG